MDAFLDFAWKNTAVLGLFFVVYRFGCILENNSPLTGIFCSQVY